MGDVSRRSTRPLYGELLLAEFNGNWVGCVGMRQLSLMNAEMNYGHHFYYIQKGFKPFFY